MNTIENINYQSRIQSLDLLRGFVVMLMALDHVRDFIGPTLFDPVDVSQTTIALYFTRWITNLCAPTFVLLTGVSAYLYGRKVCKKELSFFLIKRGLFLVMLECLVINYAWSFDFSSEFVLQVIWLLGNCMIVLAGLIWLPRSAILVLSLLIIFCHNFFDAIHVTEPYTVSSAFLSYLHELHHFHGQYLHVEISYPLIPWIGLAGFGYCLGNWMLQLKPIRTRKFFQLGLVFLFLFAIIRATNLYGDHELWQSHSRGVIYTVMSFINTTKYPPSLLYILLNVGIIGMLWPLWENWQNSGSKILITFGKVAMFFYVLHIFVIHLVADAYSKIFLHAAPGWWWSENDTVAYPLSYHFSIARVYLTWLIVLLLLYPVCRFYQRYKATHNYFWLKYL